MISVQDAIHQIRANTTLLHPVNLRLQAAAGLVLAEDVFAQASVPAFNQSAMDGYAFRFADLQKKNAFVIEGEVAAGDRPEIKPFPQQAVRIFTGAAVPDGFDTVVMQEKTEVIDGRLSVRDEQIDKGTNVRPKGVEINSGDLALAKGTALTPAAIGYLAGVGIADVQVYPRPVVHIIVTGKELQKAGQPLQPGQVYESNAVMLQAALQQLHVTNVTTAVAGDDTTEIAAAIASALEKADLLILCGGVSVGDYDFVIPAAESCGVQQLFHKVAQRPGKPLYVGRKETKMVFGLPGNPASVLSCFYNYVIVAIEELTGRKNLVERRSLPLRKAFSKKIALTQFLKASFGPDGVLPLTAQESFRLSSFSVANCLIVLPEEPHEFAEGEMVEVLLLPYL